MWAKRVHFVLLCFVASYWSLDIFLQLTEEDAGDDEEGEEDEEEEDEDDDQE